MSGGSFSYLCFKEPEELFEDAPVESLSEMAEALRAAGADDAAAETQTIVTIVQAQRHRVRVHAERLRSVWHAMEWWKSCDYSEEQFRSALAAYREEPTRT